MWQLLTSDSHDYVRQIAVNMYVRLLTQPWLLSHDYSHHSLLQSHCTLSHQLQASSEYSELPVRHNEDGLNKTLSSALPLTVQPPESFDSPHTKTYLLLQAHFSRAQLPIADYSTDTKSVLDQSLRILQVSDLVSWNHTAIVLILVNGWYICWWRLAIYHTQGDAPGADVCPRKVDIWSHHPHPTTLHHVSVDQPQPSPGEVFSSQKLQH